MIANVGQKLLYFPHGIDVCVNSGSTQNLPRQYVKYLQKKVYIIVADSKKFDVMEKSLIFRSNETSEICHKFMFYNALSSGLT